MRGISVCKCQWLLRLVLSDLRNPGVCIRLAGKRHCSTPDLMQKWGDLRMLPVEQHTTATNLLHPEVDIPLAGYRHSKVAAGMAAIQEAASGATHNGN